MKSGGRYDTVTYKRNHTTGPVYVSVAHVGGVPVRVDLRTSKEGSEYREMMTAFTEMINLSLDKGAGIDSIIECIGGLTGVVGVVSGCLTTFREENLGNCAENTCGA
jgi:hypothetical protein